MRAAAGFTGRRGLLALLLVLFCVSLAGAQGTGIFSRPDCTVITSPVNGSTVCWDSTAKKWRYYDTSVSPARYISDAANAIGWINVKDYGCKGDGAADDRTCFTNAVAALSTSGGVIYIPPGTYVTTSASALVSMTNKNNVTLRGAGVGLTTLQQKGAGNIIELLWTSGGSGQAAMFVRDMTLDGQNTANFCLRGINLEDSGIERLAITGCQNSAIQLEGIATLHVYIRDIGRLTSGTPIVAGAKGIALPSGGNDIRIERVYFNIGGNDAGHYGTALDVRGVAHVTSYGNIFDSVTNAILSSSDFTSINDHFDFTSPGVQKITQAFGHSANNSLTIINPAGLTAYTSTTVALSGGATQANVSLCGGALGNLCLTAGQPSGQTFTPAALTGNTNDYAPTDANGSSFLIYRTVRISATAGDNLTGLLAGFDGQILTLVNVGTFTITATHQDALSVAANRFLFSTGANIAIAANGKLTIVYDGTTGRWRDL